MRSRQTGRELYPGSSESDELIYANALLPLSQIPGDIADAMYKQRMAALAESKFAEDRRVAKKGDLEDYLEAAEKEEQRLYGSTGGPGGTAAAPGRATAGGGGGGAPTRSIVTDPTSGEQVVSGMEFGPGSAVSADDLTKQMFLPPREQLATQLEAQRAQGEQILAEHRAAELAAGATPTAEERSQELIEQLGLREPGGFRGLSERQALGMSERELAGKKTPLLDSFFKQAGISPADSRHPLAPKDQPYEPPPPANISEAIQRALDAPEDPYRELSEGYISMEEAKALEGSEVMSGVVDGDYLGDKTGKRVMERRAYERYLRAMGETEAAKVLEETRKVAWAQEAREKEAFMNAMVPELKKAKMGDAEAAASLWWEDPKAAGKMYGGAVSIMKSHIANIPQLQRERNRVREAKELGKLREELITKTAREKALEGLRLMREDVERRQGVAKEEESGYMRAYRELLTGAPLPALQALAEKETGAMPGSITNDRWVAKARLGDDHSIRNAVQRDITEEEHTVFDDSPSTRSGGRWRGTTSIVPSGSERWGFDADPGKQGRADALWGENGAAGLANSAADTLDNLHMDLQLLDLEEAAIRGGDAAPTGESRVSITQRRPMAGRGLRGGQPLGSRGGEVPPEVRMTPEHRRRGMKGVQGGTEELEYRPEAIYGTQKGWGYTGGAGPEMEVQPLGSGGSLSFRMEGADQDATSMLNAPSYWSSVDTAAVRGGIVESSVYLNRPDPEVPRPTRRGGPKMPPGTQDQINYLAKRYEAAPYNMPPTQAMAESQLLAYNDPDAFHRAMRSAPRKGGGDTRLTTAFETGGGAATIDANVYPDDWMQGAHAKGMRRKDESPIDKGAATGPWVHVATGAEVSEGIVRSREQ